MKLKTLVKQEWLEENSKDEKTHLPNRDNFLSSISTYEGYGKSIYRENKLKEIAETVNRMVEDAEVFTMHETENWFDKVTVKRNMKSLKESNKTFQKTANEMHTLQQRLESVYEEIGNVLGRYYTTGKQDEAAEQLKKELGSK